jgi:hypothetical protein
VEAPLPYLTSNLTQTAELRRWRAVAATSVEVMKTRGVEAELDGVTKPELGNESNGTIDWR